MAASTADREAKLAALHQRLTDQVHQLRTGDDWRRWLTVAARFHDYSFNNTLLILAQRPDATRVAGYRAWQTLGRQVDKGEKGIQILAPVLRRVDPPDTGSDTSQPSVRVAGYRVTHVWDVDQTSGPPWPQRPEAILLRGHAPVGLWDRLAGIVQEKGFGLERGDCGGANGVTHFSSRVVRVRDDVDDAQAVKTLTHELGHVLLHQQPSQPLPTTLHCRGIREVEAESVAFLVAASHGLDTGAYSLPYVVGWATSVAGRAPEEVVADVGQRVLRATNEVLDRVAARVDDEPAAALAIVAIQQRERVVVAAGTALQDGLDAPALGREDTLDVRQIKAAMDDAQAFYTEQVPSSWVPNYLGGRGLASALEDSSPWRIGYAPKSWTALTDHLREAGHSDSTLAAAGLALQARTGRLVDRFRDRFMLPIRDDDGRVVAFVGRAHPDAGGQTPKYLNSPTTPIYRKGDHLLGLCEGSAAASRGATPVVVEGPMDALAVWVASRDHHAPVALCGTVLTAHQADRLRDLTREPGAPVVVALDADTAGRTAAEAAFWHLTARALQPWAVDLPRSIDPAELVEKQGPRRLAATLTADARPLIDDVIKHRIAVWSDRLHWVEGRVGAVRDVAPFIAALPPDLRPRSIAGVVSLVGIEATTACREVAAAVNTTTRAALQAGGGTGPTRGQPTETTKSTQRRTLHHRPTSRWPSP